jgi:voltage-gated potassium channel
MFRTDSATPSAGYQIFMLVLCLYALTILAIQAAAPINPSTVAILDYADFAVCLIFLGDFLLSLYRAKNRWKYFVTWGWLDLLSSIPTIDIARWGRAARILRIFRVLRGLRATQLLASIVMKRRAQNTVLAACLVALMLVTFCSIAILHFESGPDANIKSADDAVWWAFATITTVGYGDRYPTTGEGRLVAVLLMSAGVGLFGTFSGLLASWFIGAEEESSDGDLVALREEIAALRELIERDLSTKASG